MSALRIAVVGAGRRVLETALPALRAAGGAFELAGVFARAERVERSGGEPIAVRPLAELEASRLEGVDLVYLAVGKEATPVVLERLARLEPARTDLLIETPVVRFRHFRHAVRTRAFRRAWVAEDCSRLPWFDTVRAAVRAGVMEAPRALLLEHCGYAYHALAIARCLCAAGPVTGARRRSWGGRLALREVRFRGGVALRVLEPRDYASGRVLVGDGRRTLADHALGVEGHLELTRIEAGERCLGFRAGEVETRLDEAEAGLYGARASGAGLTARMEDDKRVGFLRLWRSIASGAGAYPLLDGLEDMVVDYHLERFGRYLATPLTSPRWASGRATLGLLTRAGG